MSIGEEDWDIIVRGAGPSGLSTLRLHPESPHDLALAVQNPGQHRMLIFILPAAIAAQALRTMREISETQGVTIRSEARAGQHELRLVLEDIALAGVFDVLVGDVADQAASFKDALSAATSFLQRYSEWVELLRALATDGLSLSARRGMAAELLLLHGLLDAGLNSVIAVEGWAGPRRADQDFQLPSASIEVKSTTARQPQSLRIASERQLDPTGQPRLFLAHFALDERRGGEGKSLNQLIDANRARLGEPLARRRFEELLVRAGYFPHQRAQYDEPRYAIRQELYFDLHGEFPRIIEDDLRSGVGDCSYRIELSALQPWLTSVEELHAVLIRPSTSDGGSPCRPSNSTRSLTS